MNEEWGATTKTGASSELQSFPLTFTHWNPKKKRQPRAHSLRGTFNALDCKKNKQLTGACPWFSKEGAQIQKAAFYFFPSEMPNPKKGKFSWIFDWSQWKFQKCSSQLSGSIHIISQICWNHQAVLRTYFLIPLSGSFKSLSVKPAVANVANTLANKRQIEAPRTLIGKSVNVQMVTYMI